MKTNHQALRQIAHQANLARYRRILGTHLTAAERAFLERRVTEETEALRKLAGTIAAQGDQSIAHRDQSIQSN